MGLVQPPRVFLSSALKGLEDLRSIVAEFFEKKRGYAPVYYGDRSSGSLTGQPGIVEQCLDGVRSSDAFVLIVDRRYGEPIHKVRDGGMVSLTELEFIEASNQGIPTFVFCRDEVWAIHKFWTANPTMSFDVDSRYDHPDELMSFVSRLRKEDHFILRFRDAVDLTGVLSRIELSVDMLRNHPRVVAEREDLEGVLD